MERYALLIEPLDEECQRLTSAAKIAEFLRAESNNRLRVTYHTYDVEPHHGGDAEIVKLRSAS